MAAVAMVRERRLLLVLLAVVGCPHPPAGFTLSCRRAGGSAERCLLESDLDIELDRIDRSSFIRCTPAAPVDAGGAPLLMGGQECDVWFTDQPEGEAHAFRLRARCPTGTPNKEQTQRAAALRAYELISSRCPGFPPVNEVKSQDM